MIKYIFVLTGIFFSLALIAQQPTQEQLEKQRQQLKKELEQTQALLNQNKSKQKENLLQWRLINDKVNLQGKVVGNINRDLRMLNDNMYLLQKEINLYNRILDTLKQEYAQSMVYAYKNRNNYDFLNFIFSANSFNDAIKRITYLRSYRNFREMQGQNILRTQEQRQKKVEELKKMREKKNSTLKDQRTELEQLAREQKEKDRILAELKKQGKALDKQIASKKVQMKKVNNAIAAAIKKAQEEAIRIAKAKEAEERKKREAEMKASAGKATTTSKPETPSAPAITSRKPGESVLLNSESMVKLNASFEQNKGLLPWPVDRGNVLIPYGNYKLPSGIEMVNTGITIAADIGTPVKSVFTGKVSRVFNIEDMYVVVVQHGRYFISYSNLKDVTVRDGDEISTGKVIGKVATTLDGIGSIDLIISDERSNHNPQTWLRKSF